MEVERITFSSYSSSSSLLPLIILLSITYGYCYFLVKKLPKGIPRLVFLLPVFYILFVVPWCFLTSISLRGYTSFLFSWISSFKLILFSFDRGDLIFCNNYAEFVAVAALPLKIKPKFFQKPSFLQVVKTILELLLIALPFTLISFQYVTLLVLLALFVGFSGGIRVSCLEVIPVLNQVHRATSLQVFWGKRWNRISSNILRYTIYEPTLESLKRYVGLNAGKAVSLIITLVVSGIMHEIMFYHMTCGMKPTWEVTHFFVMQGICMAIEALIKRFWVQTLGQPPVSPFISVSLTLGFVLATSYWLLVLPVWRITGHGCNGKGYGLNSMQKWLSVFET